MISSLRGIMGGQLEVGRKQRDLVYTMGSVPPK